MDAADVRRWLEAYERAWRTPGTASLGDVFTEDVTYLPSPWAEPVRGLAALAAFWEAERDGPDEVFTMTGEVVAVEGSRAVARVAVDYATGGRWRDLWVLELIEAGRCRAFEEWPHSPEPVEGLAPDQPDGN